MKNILKKNAKLFVGILIGGIIFGSFGVYAGTVIAGTNITYDNTNTSSTSTNVQNAIDDLYTKANYGDAKSENLLSGTTALVKGGQITGAMTNNGAWTSKPTANGQVTIPEGYHDGTGYVDTSTVYTLGYNTGINATKSASNFSITIPVTVTIKDYQDGWASYSKTLNVKVNGDLANQKITVTKASVTAYWKNSSSSNEMAIGSVAAETYIWGTISAATFD